MSAPLLARLRAAGLTVSRNGGQLIVTPRERLTEDLRASIRQQKAELLAALSAADPMAAFTAAIRSGALQQCQACRHFAKLIPANGDDQGVPDAGWCRHYNVATHPITPFYCDGYTPAADAKRGTT